jgi:hypothetical protein
MATDRVNASRPIRLTFRSEMRVVVEPDDEDRFVMTMREAALACKQVADNKAWEEAFDTFLVYLEKWSESHADKVSAVYFSVGDGALNIFVCTPSELYDIELDDIISELDIALVQKFPWLVADVLQIPGSLQGERFPLEKAILVYGDGKRAPAAGPT